MSKFIKLGAVLIFLVIAYNGIKTSEANKDKKIAVRNWEYEQRVKQYQIIAKKDSILTIMGKTWRNRFKFAEQDLISLKNSLYKESLKMGILEGMQYKVIKTSHLVKIYRKNFPKTDQNWKIFLKLLNIN